MYSGLLTAIKNKKILPIKEIRQYLWQDEGGEKFLLTKNAEIFLYDDDTLGVYLFKNKIKLLKSCKKMIQISNILLGDDLYTFRTDIANLPLLLSTTGHLKGKFSRAGKTLQNISKLLGHMILFTRGMKDSPEFLEGNIPVEVNRYTKTKRIGVK